MSRKNLSLRFFKLGVDFIPDWFKSIMRMSKVEWVFTGNVMKECIITNSDGDVRRFKAGTIITSDMLFD